jgi:hypothetical protein
MRDQRMREPRAERPRRASDIIPALTHGVVAEGTGGAGERFIQPYLRPEALARRYAASVCGPSPVALDRITGGGFVVLARHPMLLDGVSARARAALARLNARCLSPERSFEALDAEGQLATWFAQRGAAAVIVRPDFYVYGSALTGSELDELILRLERDLHLHPNEPQEATP